MSAALKINPQSARRLDESRQRAARAQARRRGARLPRQGAGAAAGRSGRPAQSRQRAAHARPPAGGARLFRCRCWRAIRAMPTPCSIAAPRSPALGRTEQALADFDAALALAPGHPAALYNRGNALSDARPLRRGASPPSIARSPPPPTMCKPGTIAAARCKRSTGTPTRSRVSTRRSRCKRIMPTPISIGR